ncbi:hypothetical protein VPH35_070507 [Triticum aestivum]
MGSHGKPPLPYAYKPLPSDADGERAGCTRWRVCAVALTASAMVVVVVGATLLAGFRVDQAVDEEAAGGFPWSNEMLQWQRSGYHFQTAKNYMSGLMYYRGWYHMFFQYNPVGTDWDDGMEWGHAVSRNLVQWRTLPIAMVADQWYDILGVLSGSMTVLPNGTVIMIYTGATNASAVEVDSKRADVVKGWASIQSVPRTIALDEKTRTNLLLWPVEEIETLRLNATELSDVTLNTGSVIHIPLRQGTQLDIEATFHLDASAVAALNEADVGYNCSSSGGAVNRGALGPFGLLVLAAGDRRGEQTAVYFYVSRGLDGGLHTSFCQDELRSSRAKDVTKRVIGSTVPVLDGEAFSMRVLVDHSIVQGFAMGGRTTMTSRVYPMEAYQEAKVYLFNNATGASVTAERLVVHEMDSAHNQLSNMDDHSYVQ